MRRYSIMVVERDSDREIELCQVDSDPQAIAQAALGKKLMVASRAGNRRISIPKYLSVRVQENLVAQVS